MTDLALTIRQPSLFTKLFRRLIDWLNEPVAADTPQQLSPRDWADLPTYHPSALPTRDGRGAR